MGTLGIYNKARAPLTYSDKYFTSLSRGLILIPGHSSGQEEKSLVVTGKL